MERLKLYYQSATKEELLNSVFGMGMSYAKGNVTREWCKERIKELKQYLIKNASSNNRI